jgi:hypothetical protein
MTSPKQPHTEDDFSWLRQLQKNSWEPEVIISGITLAIIFAFPAELYGFGIRLIQDFGIEFIGAWLVLIYLSLVINLFKIFFSVHLILRFAWTGLLGLSYAFPDGVINANLFKFSQDFEYKKPHELVLKLERICSMTFGIPLMFGIIFIIFTGYLGLLLLIYLLFDFPFYIIYFLFLISVFAFAMFNMMAKKKGLRNWLSQSLYNNISAIYQSNLGRWPVTIYTVFILILSIPFVSMDTDGFFDYFNTIGEGTEDWPNSSHYFDDLREPGRRIPRTSIPSAIVEGNYLPLMIAYYREDKGRIETIQNLYQVSKDTLPWQEIHAEQDLYRIFINDSLINIPSSKWRKTMSGSAEQKVFQCILDLQGLPPGIHEVRLEKLVAVDFMGIRKAKLRHRKNWSRFSFVKT